MFISVTTHNAVQHNAGLRYGLWRDLKWHICNTNIVTHNTSGNILSSSGYVLAYFTLQGCMGRLEGPES